MGQNNLNSRWVKKTLGELCEETGGLVQTGPFGSQLHESDYSEEGIPVVMPKDIIDGTVEISSIARVSKEHVDRLSKHRVNSGDIIYGRRGDIGRQALIRPDQEGWLCGTGCLRISLGNSVIDPVFLHYYLRKDSVIKSISNQAVGSTMPNLNTSILKGVPIEFPERVDDQVYISRILAKYDDLIINNQSRIKILQETLILIYRESFLSTDGESNVEIGTLADISQLIRIKYSDEENLPLVDMARIKSKYLTCSLYGSPKELKTSRIIFERDDILFGSIRTYLHKVILAPFSGVTNTSVFVFRSINKNYLSLLTAILFSDETIRWANQHSTGTKMPLIKKDLLMTMPVPVPNNTELRKFNDVADRILLEIQNLGIHNLNLTKTRDLLLPKLMSMNQRKI